MKRETLLLWMLFSFIGLQAQSILPYPKQVISPDKKLDLSSIQSIYLEDKELLQDAEVFNDFLRKAGRKQPLPISKSKQNALILAKDERYRNEHYKIESVYGNNIKITGQSQGVFYGLMTVLQGMLSTNKIPKIDDEPYFSWRGMHLDVARHFFDKEFIKKYIDLLALHKMNTFHWHLTDDQGWRIEIKEFPKLTTVGGTRKETMVEKNFSPYVGDGVPVTGFYTQEEIKEIVAYATARHVTVVPEIEMPGHAQAALAAYPQYGCTRNPMEVMTIWGVSEDVFCPNQSTVTFLKKILDEVMELFPSKYIHIGGDEVPKTRWKSCEICQYAIRKNKLRNENELQSFFIKQIDAYLASKGRSAIGWDEILEGGLAPNAAIMSWRGEEGGIQAARLGHAVVMTPGSHCYFDHYQGSRQTEPLAIGGYTPLDKVYSYWPVPDSLDADQKKFILGAQGNVWTEYMATNDHVEYMVLPRLTALAEVLWTGKERPGYANYIQRLLPHFDFLKLFGYNYSKALYDVKLTNQANGGFVFVDAQIPLEEGKILYTLDGSEPNASSPVYTKRVFINKSCTVNMQYFEHGEAKGNMASRSFDIHKAVNAKISSTVNPIKNELSLLTNGHIAKPPKAVEEYTCWKDIFPEITLDLHRPTEIKEIALHALKEWENNNYLPTNIRIESSNDGKMYTVLKTLPTLDINQSYLTNGYIRCNVKVKARYLRMRLENKNKPVNRSEKAWLLLSEISVK
jgi:hexosaminidase